MEPSELLVSIVAIVSSSLLVFGVFYIYFRNRNRERMLMIEKGVDPSTFIQKPKGSLSITLKYGLLLVGIAIGILMGTILDYATPINDGFAYFSMMLLFGGLGLLTYYLIERNNDDSRNG